MTVTMLPRSFPRRFGPKNVNEALAGAQAITKDHMLDPRLHPFPFQTFEGGCISLDQCGRVEPPSSLPRWREPPRIRKCFPYAHEKPKTRPSHPFGKS